jgi:hypothetical protein
VPQNRPSNPEERRAAVAEIMRRYGAGEGTYSFLAAQLGVKDKDFYNWRRLYPAPPEPVAPAKTELEASKGKPPVHPYSPAEREHLRLEVERLRAAGHSTRSACATVGIAEDSYRRWRIGATAPAMRPVEIKALVPAAPQALSLVPPNSCRNSNLASPANLAVTSPNGYRVEGLSVETAAALLRALT